LDIRKNANSPLETKSYQMAVRVVNMVKHVQCSPKEYGMLNQIFRSGTAVGALVSEAVYAQSPADFVSKLSIALKECSETLYWLQLLRDTGYITEKEHDSMEKDSREVLAILISSIKTVKNNNNK